MRRCFQYNVRHCPCFACRVSVSGFRQGIPELWFSDGTAIRKLRQTSRGRKSPRITQCQPVRGRQAQQERHLADIRNAAKQSSESEYETSKKKTAALRQSRLEVQTQLACFHRTVVGPKAPENATDVKSQPDKSGFRRNIQICVVRMLPGTLLKSFGSHIVVQRIDEH